MSCRLPSDSIPPAPPRAPRPRRLELQGDRKWVVEHHSGNREIMIDRTDPKHTVYIYNCHNCVVQVGARCARPRACSGAGVASSARRERESRPLPPCGSFTVCLVYSIDNSLTMHIK